MGRFALLGFAWGFAPLLIFGPLFLLPGASVRSFPWATFVILNPLIGAGLGHLFYEYPYGTLYRRASFYANEPLRLREHQARERRIGRFASAGFGLGVAAGLVATNLEVACRGWAYFAPTLFPALFLYPGLGITAGLNFGLRPRDPRPSIRHPTASFRTVAIAIFAGIADD